MNASVINISELKELYRKIESPSYKPEDREKNIKQLQELLKRSFEQLRDCSYLKNVRPFLEREFCKFTRKAAKKGFLPSELSTDIAKHLRDGAFEIHEGKSQDFTIYIKDQVKDDNTNQIKIDSLKIDSSFLIKNSDVFKIMLDSSMKEATQKSMSLSGYSKAAVECLFKFLQEAFPTKKIQHYSVKEIHFLRDKPVDLPTNPYLLLELFDLIQTYRFKDLLKAIQPALSNLMKKQPEIFTAHLEEWCNLLLPLKEETEAGKTLKIDRVYFEKQTVKEEKDVQSVLDKIIHSLTPIILKSLEIPWQKIRNTFAIPAEEIGNFFNPETKDLLELLPTALHINGENDIESFKTSSEAAGKQAPHSIRLLGDFTTQTKEEIRQSSGMINLDFISIKPEGTIFYDQDTWRKYLGTIENIASKPPKEFKEGTMTFFVPKKMDGKNLTLKQFIERVKYLKRGSNGNKMLFKYFTPDVLSQYEKISFPEDHWIQMPLTVTPGSRGMSYDAQVRLINDLSDQENVMYEYPELVDILVGTCLYFINTGERLFPDDPCTYTRVAENIGKYNVCVGKFSASGLRVRLHYSGDDAIGVTALRKF